MVLGNYQVAFKTREVGEDLGALQFLGAELYGREIRGEEARIAW